jgi:DNA-binding NtrC family response regulator
MAAHILQIAYYPTLKETRAEMLEEIGYRVTSVLGNDDAIRLDEPFMSTVDAVVFGFCSPQSVRQTMIQWLKRRYPMLPVVALQFYDWETIPEADACTLSENPKVWLSTIANVLKA